MLDDAVRVGVIFLNIAKPTRIRRVRRRAPDSLTAEQDRYLRDTLGDWYATRDRPGPSPDARVLAIVDVLLVLGIRIGEVLALRTCDVQLAASPPRVAIAATPLDEEGGAGVARPPQGAATDARARAPGLGDGGTESTMRGSGRAAVDES